MDSVLMNLPRWICETCGHSHTEPKLAGQCIFNGCPTNRVVRYRGVDIESMSREELLDVIQDMGWRLLSFYRT